MRQSFVVIQSEIKEAYKVNSKQIERGEEVAPFCARYQDSTLDKHFFFDAPRCSSNFELLLYAEAQNPELRKVNNGGLISYRIVF